MVLGVSVELEIPVVLAAVRILTVGRLDPTVPARRILRDGPVAAPLRDVARKEQLQLCNVPFREMCKYAALISYPVAK